MQNFEFEHDGEKLWYSRSLACNAMVFRCNGDEFEVLACKRGQGCEFNKGKWNVPGGFIDFNETAKECALRELKEETGLELSSDCIEFFDLNTDPVGARQTMVAMFTWCFPKERTLSWNFTTEYSEDREIDEIKWINIKDLKKYNWTRGQIMCILQASDYHKINKKNQL